LRRSESFYTRDESAEHRDESACLMKVIDPTGQFEAESTLESSRGDRFDERDSYRLVVRDRATGKEVLVRYHRSSYSHMTEIESGRGSAALEFTADGKYLRVNFANGSVDIYPLPGVGEGCDTRADGKLALEWSMGDRSTGKAGTFQSTKVRFLDPATNEVLDDYTFKALNKPPVEQVRFTDFHDLVLGLAGDEIEIHFSGLRNEVMGVTSDDGSPSGRLALALQTGALGPVERATIVTVWETETGKVVKQLSDYRPTHRYRGPAPLLAEARFVSETDVWLRYQDGTHRTAMIAGVTVERSGAQLSDDGRAMWSIEGGFLRAAGAEDGWVRLTVRLPEERNVACANIEFWGLMEFAVRIRFDDGGEEIHRSGPFTEWGKWMEIV